MQTYSYLQQLCFFFVYIFYLYVFSFYFFSPTISVNILRCKLFCCVISEATETSYVLSLCHQRLFSIESTKNHGKNHIWFRQPLIRHLFRNYLLTFYTKTWEIYENNLCINSKHFMHSFVLSMRECLKPTTATEVELDLLLTNYSWLKMKKIDTS